MGVVMIVCEVEEATKEESEKEMRIDGAAPPKSRSRSSRGLKARCDAKKNWYLL